jgi:hypothetical protein
MDMGFTIFCPLAPCRRPRYPVLVHRLALLLHASFRLRLAAPALALCYPSPPSGWERTFTFKLLNMLGTQKKAASDKAALFAG